MRVSLDGWVNGVLILGILGVWRMTHLLHAEDGPGQAVVKLRRAAGDGVLGQAMDCFQCLRHGRDADAMAVLPHLKRAQSSAT